MTLQIFFQPLEAYILDDDAAALPNAMGTCISSYYLSFPDLIGAKVALIGIPELPVKKGLQYDCTYYAANAIRSELYKLNYGKSATGVVDLGNIVPGNNANEAMLRLEQVCQTLISDGTLPILLGGSNQMVVAQFSAVADIDRPHTEEAAAQLDARVNMVNIDALIDLDHSQSSLTAKNHLSEILYGKPGRLGSYTHLGAQSFRNTPLAMAEIVATGNELLRIGELRDTPSEAEPLLRATDCLAVDVSAVRVQDAPAQINGFPFGFTAEEVCQLCWYAGHSSRLKIAGFYGVMPHLDSHNQTSKLFATMVWYVIEGVYYRDAFPLGAFDGPSFRQYNLEVYPGLAPLVFYHHLLSGKWWLGINYQDNAPLYIVPCAPEDFELAKIGEIPERYTKALNRLNKVIA